MDAPVHGSRRNRLLEGIIVCIGKTAGTQRTPPETAGDSITGFPTAFRDVHEATL